MNGSMMTFLPLILILVVMYFLMIRPQKKKEKQINELRRSVRAGDQIITIGGIHGKIVKAKEESLIIQVGSDKVKFEIMRWAVSRLVESSAKPEPVDETPEEDVEPKAALPKQLKKGTDKGKK